MAGEFSFEDINLNFDSISHSGIYKCEQCNMFVPYRLLAEHIQLRHKSTNDYFDDGQPLLKPSANQCDSDGLANHGDLDEHAIFRRRAPRPNFLDSDFDTTDTESMVTNIKNRHNTVAATNGGTAVNAGAGASAMPNGDNRAYGGRTAARDGDRYQQKRLAKLQAAREQQQQQQTKNNERKSNGNDSSAPASLGAQSRRKIQRTEMFSKNRSQSEARSQKFNGIFSNGIGGGVGVSGNERAGSMKINTMRRSVSVQRAPKIPENFEHCKFCMNLMHKDHIKDHIARKHQIDEPATDTNDVSVDAKTIVVTNDNANDAGSSSSDVGDVEDNLNGKSDDGLNGTTGNSKKVKAPYKKIKKSKAVDEHKGFRRCQFCEAFIFIDFLAGHMIRKHNTKFTGASGITWLKYSDDQMNKLIQEGRLSCKNGALYIDNA